MHYLRVMWGARRRRHSPGRLVKGYVRGVALHHPGMTLKLRDVKSVKKALRSFQNYHMNERNWSDIAYQKAYDQAGNSYRLRGMKNRSAANGDLELNERYGAFLLLVANGETPSKAMVKAVNRDIAKFHKRYGCDVVVGHGDIRPDGTDCPGDETRILITEGVIH